MEDPASTHNFITHGFAKVLKMPSKPALLSLEVFQGTVEAEPTRTYLMSLTDMYGRDHLVQAIGIGSLMEAEKAPGMKVLISQFPQVDCQSIKAFRRTHGKVEVMLRMLSRSLHCRDGQESGKLRLNTRIFAP